MMRTAADRADDFDRHRPLLFSLAYRMLGSVMDAEDMVQEAFLRWLHAGSAAVESPRAYLTTVVTRLCIDHLRSARARREQYVGIWLPEPLLTDGDGDPADAPLLHETVSVAFLVLLQTLGATERACFLLREVFGNSYAEIAGIVDETETNCRQMVSRARRRLADRRPRFAVDPADLERLTDEFLRACVDGDTHQLMTLLAEDVALYSDGGGKVSAARNPVRGRDRVARFFLGLMSKAPRDVAITRRSINGRPALVTTIHDHIYNTVSFDVVNDQVRSVYIVANPDKLRALSGGDG